MGGGLLQLVSSGKQGIHLSSNPQISFFKQVHKRHTNFSIETIPLNFSQEPDFGKKSRCKIYRHGDLLNKCILEIFLPKLTGIVEWTNGIGNAIIKEIKLYIGGELIDTMDGQLLDIYAEFFLDEGKRNTYYDMIGYSTIFDGDGDTNDKAMRLFVPLEFWFCRNIGSSLPLVSMQYHDVEIEVEFRPFKELYNPNVANPPLVSITRCRLYADYIFLDIAERKEFAKRNHEYLILQHQVNIDNSIKYSQKNINIDLTFNHPTKALFWFVKSSQTNEENLWFDYDPRPIPILGNTFAAIKMPQFIDSVALKLNGQDRFQRMSGEFFRYIEPYKRCKNIPDRKNIYNYNFGFNTHQFQPNGYLNFSRIDNSTLQIELVNNPDIKDDNLFISIYAINYNILKVDSGMGGLLYKD